MNLKSVELLITQAREESYFLEDIDRPWGFSFLRDDSQLKTQVRTACRTCNRFYPVLRLHEQQTFLRFVFFIKLKSKKKINRGTNIWNTIPSINYTFLFQLISQFHSTKCKFLIFIHLRTGTIEL